MAVLVTGRLRDRLAYRARDRFLRSAPRNLKLPWAVPPIPIPGVLGRVGHGVRLKPAPGAGVGMFLAFVQSS